MKKIYEVMIPFVDVNGQVLAARAFIELNAGVLGVGMINGVVIEPARPNWVATLWVSDLAKYCRDITTKITSGPSTPTPWGQGVGTMPSCGDLNCTACNPAMQAPNPAPGQAIPPPWSAYQCGDPNCTACGLGGGGPMPFEDLSKPYQPPRCECGAEKAKSPSHAGYCPKAS